MLGRMVLPIIFHDGEKEIIVKEIHELKEYFKDEYIPELVDAVKTIRLQQFFFGHGKDDIRDLIVSLKEQGVSEIEILNQVADMIGAKRLSQTAWEEKNASSLDEMLTKDDKESVFIKYENISFKQYDFSISTSKTVISLGKKVFLEKDLSIKVEKNAKVVFKELNFEGAGKVFSLSVCKGCKVEFINCNFTGVRLNIDYGEVEFIRCNVSKSEIGILANDSNLKLVECKVFENSSIGIYCVENSEITISNSKVFENKGGGIVINQSKFNINESEIYSNGNSNDNYPQIGIISSMGQIDGSLVYKGVNTNGIYCVENSDITISNSKVFENKHGGIKINQSKFNINKSEIYSNGNSSDSYSQIEIESSTGQIDDSLVYKGVNTGGIYCDKNSDITISNSKVFENYINGIVINQSKFNISKSEIYSNGNSSDSYPQIGIMSSTGQIDSSLVYKGVNAGGIYCDKNSEITVSNSKVFENYFSGVAINQSKFNISKSEIYSNGNSSGSYPQIGIMSSTGQIDGSLVYKGVKAVGIYCVENSEITVSNSKVFENYYNGIFINQSKFNISKSEIYSNGNDNGDYPQIWIESSTGQINSSSVYNGVNTYGIYVESSKVDLSNVKTWGNIAGIDNDTQSNITKTNCDFKESGCFITTAVVKTLGKDDNCYELNTFRKYRDSYIKSLPDGDTIISEYYSIAPKIVEKIEQQSNKEQIYSWIWNEFLKPCLEYIEQGKYKETKDKYTQMVKILTDKYLI